ncbi:hypothetical protein, conserved [Trypanosoma vivax Y486]|uniref:CCHC-type domain-containing protein n=1 Tax=Trypanosoma vivax (strain Y486) TaxID=1055687 RepID=F9WQZ6_TRYVY|nr:hypothetical protein, conserved [Trypanosoma vivax Y486]|eukprot:CCD19979.1 hypothetical protein, conserved [Trypanosoma vivax Y486]
MKNISPETSKNCFSSGHLRRDCPLIKYAACSRQGHFKEDCTHRRRRARADNDIGICRSCGSSNRAQAKCPERKKSVECFQCHQKGHMMPMCPQTRCFNCDHFGHSSQLCGSKEVCFHCSMPWHTSTECPRKDMGRLCYRCKEPGHDEAKCPQIPQCHMCNQTAHLVAQCPEVLCNRCHQKGHMAIACKMSPCSTDGGSHSSIIVGMWNMLVPTPVTVLMTLKERAPVHWRRSRLAVNRKTPTTKVEILAQPSVPVPKRHQYRLLSHAGLSARVAWPLL